MALVVAAETDVAAVVVSSYHVSTTVKSRLLTTSIEMVLSNSRDCTSLYDLTLRLPKSARVKDVSMDLSNGCELKSHVKKLDDAVEDFEDFHASGKAASILTAWDTNHYDMEVSILPGGSTNVTLTYQELLVQKLGEVSFQVPMFPGMAVVDDLKVEVLVEDPVTGILGVRTDLGDKLAMETTLNETTASLHFEKRGGVTSEESSHLPRLFRAHFRPGPLPEEGLFLTDGEYFAHVFHPTSFLEKAGSMARKIVFVIDVSGSMAGQKLADAKTSFASMIDNLDERDTLIVQSFSYKGTEDRWGPGPATLRNKKRAKKFVDRLQTIGSTNLNDAFLDGIASVQNAPETMVPILVIMTDGYGNVGPRVTAQNVRETNAGGTVKMFSIAFGKDADMDLLKGIAAQNGGRVVKIHEGFGDSSDQMESFYRQELGSVLLSDIEVSYKVVKGGGFFSSVSESTISSFPVLATGSEIVVRGKLESRSEDAASGENRSNILDDTTTRLRCVVSAKSATGPVEWPVDHVVVDHPPKNKKTKENGALSDLRLAFAQARISELLDYRDASRSIGRYEILSSSAYRSSYRSSSRHEEEALELVNFEAAAQAIALDAGLVWPGLTALVTKENEDCPQMASEACDAGTGRTSELYRGQSVTAGDPSRIGGSYASMMAGSAMAGSTMAGSMMAGSMNWGSTEVHSHSSPASSPSASPPHSHSGPASMPSASPPRPMDWSTRTKSVSSSHRAESRSAEYSLPQGFSPPNNNNNNNNNNVVQLMRLDSADNGGVVGWEQHLGMIVTSLLAALVVGLCIRHCGRRHRRRKQRAH
jgi:Mg-chelatase subunit ChlD